MGSGLQIHLSTTQPAQSFSCCCQHGNLAPPLSKGAAHLKCLELLQVYALLA